MFGHAQHTTNTNADTKTNREIKFIKWQSSMKKCIIDHTEYAHMLQISSFVMYRGELRKTMKRYQGIHHSASRVPNCFLLALTYAEKLLRTFVPH